jgi:hypothetical protein
MALHPSGVSGMKTVCESYQQERPRGYFQKYFIDMTARPNILHFIDSQREIISSEIIHFINTLLLPLYFYCCSHSLLDILIRHLFSGFITKFCIYQGFLQF